jgi:hypothetical protein
VKETGPRQDLLANPIKMNKFLHNRRRTRGTIAGLTTEFIYGFERPNTTPKAGNPDPAKIEERRHAAKSAYDHLLQS